MYQSAPPDPAMRPDSTTRHAAQPARHRTLHTVLIGLITLQTLIGLGAVIHAYNVGDDDDLLSVGLCLLLAALAGGLTAILYRPLKGVWIIAGGILRLLADELDERR